tara:strand:- start:531 stop:1949 length:1419 start_codon:yes stop_codon:yes gene_type:complete
MATTKLASPQVFTPAYNPCKFIMDSTNKNQLGFKYIFDVYDAVTNALIGQYRVFPQYLTGYGEIDISKLLQTKVSYDSDLYNTVPYDAVNSYYKYDVMVGEEFITTVAYTSALTNNAGNVRITATHSYVVGDQVRINQADSGAANPNLEGLFTVLSIVGTTSFTINSLWSQVTNAAIDGTVSYSDNRKTVIKNILGISNRYVFNGAMSFQDWINWESANYILNNSSDLLLTDMPKEGFYSTYNQDLIINFGNANVTTNFVFFENDGGNVFSKPITTNSYVSGVPVGPSNYGSLTLVSGVGPLINTTTEYYDFWYGTMDAQRSQKYRVNIDKRCAIEDYSLLFLDRMGSYGSFAFQLRAYEKGTVQKQGFNRDIQGSVTSEEWGYTSESFGQSIYSSNVTKTLDLNTNWMTEEMSIYFEQLITSPLVYLKMPDETYVAVIINENSFEVNKQRNKKLFKKSITVTFANQNTINV